MVDILDTTLRDGSYTVDFQFDAHDTSVIASALDQNGIKYIEIGHGMGLNASCNQKMKAACSDVEYLEATANAVKKGKWGMFFIPGIGRYEDIELASRYGMDFIRIGTNVTEVEQAERYIYRAKELGMMVSSNFMKTYAISADEVGRKAAIVKSYGAEIVSLVDSAGGMFPEDIEEYFTAIRRHTDVALGYHGHNNMGMAVANTLRAVELGAKIVDTSLRGLGRSAGNAATEIFLFVLRRKNIDLGIDPIKLMDIAEQFIDPLIKNRIKNDSISIVSGYAQFHSSFLGIILEYAEKYNIDPRELIICVCKEDKVNAPKELVEKLAIHLSEIRKPDNKVYFVSWEKKTEKVTSQELDLVNRAVKVSKETDIIAKKMGHFSVFNLVQSLWNSRCNSVSSVIHDGELYTVASAEVAVADVAKEIAKKVSLGVDYILLDDDIKTAYSNELLEKVKQVVPTGKLLLYSDVECWGKSIALLIKGKVKTGLAELDIVFLGNNLISKYCRNLLELCDAKVTVKTKKELAECTEKPDIIVYCEKDINEHFEPKLFIVDAMIGSMTEENVLKCFQKRISVYRPDMRVVIHSEIASVFGMTQLLEQSTGSSYIEGILVAAGGLVAPRGAVILDSIRTPKKIYGIADGKGFLLSDVNWDDTMKDSYRTIERYILFKRGNHK